MEKYAVLAGWARAFEKEHGRTPTLWLDKACIDQGNIDASLSGLPVFLSGCKRLLVLAGPTYAQRLWCCMEVFVFLQMGGTPERITVLPFGMSTGPAAG